MDSSSFYTHIYDIVRQIPAGKVLSYGDIARLAGKPQCSRQVGQALHQAPPSLPCHRVVNSSGRTAPHWPRQKTLLEAEGVTFGKGGSVRMHLHRWEIPEE